MYICIHARIFDWCIYDWNRTFEFDWYFWIKNRNKIRNWKKSTHLTLSSIRPDLPDHFTIFYRRKPISNCSLSLHVLFYIFSLFLWPDLTSAWPQQWCQHASKPGACIGILGSLARGPPGGSSPSWCRWLVTDSFPGGGLGACDSAGPPWFAQSFETDRLGI